MTYKSKFWKRLKLGAVFMAALAGIGGAALPAHAEEIDTVCVPITDMERFSKKIPKLYKNFQKMSRLPLTGKDLHKRLRAADDISICQTITDDAQSFFDKRIWLEGIAGTSAEFHEYFHAGQDASGAWHTLQYPRLTTRDNVMANMLFEATALAYQLVSEQEAKNRGVQFQKPAKKMDFVSDQADIRQRFQEIYDKALVKYQCESKALEIAGQEAGRYLLGWKNVRWSEGYASHALEVARAVPSMITGDDPGYAKRRRDLYLKAGYVSPSINLTPEEFVGPEADRHIEARFNEQFRIKNGKVLLAEPKSPGLK